MTGLHALAAALLGLAGCLLPGASGGLFAALAWAAIAAPAAGHLAAAETRAALALAPGALLVATFGAWSVVGGPPLAAWALAALAGLFLLGVASGWTARSPWPGAGAWLAVGLFLAAAPTGAGVLARPWPPELAARLLDLSPVSLALESGGVDWMRHPAVYEPAGTADIGPEVRRAWSGSIAGGGLFVVGCAAFVARLVRARRTAQPSAAEAGGALIEDD